MSLNRLWAVAACLMAAMAALAQGQVVSGLVATPSGQPVAYATVDIGPGEQWGMTDEQGTFALRLARTGKAAVRVSCVGYATIDTTVTIGPSTPPLRLTMAESTLQLDQVVVTAQRRTEGATTSYVIDRQALDNQQIINVSDIATLLPGGKTVNSSLMTDQRLALRAETGERGNAAFGTAIEVDGQRLQNNAEVGETTGASTRGIATTNVASVEVVPGIPSVEYGDLTSGIVKVSTKRGRTPWEIALATNPHTKQVAVSKGFDLRHGVLNASLEHTRSYSSLASPHTAYQRNTLSLNYRTTTMLAGHRLVLDANVSGNAGGYNSKADPDQFVDTYTRVRDRVLRGALQADWTPGSPWLASLSLHADFSVADKRRTSLANANSSSTQACIHAMEPGYYIATDYDLDPTAPIILSPTGYWYVKSYRDNQPRSLLVKLKARSNQQHGAVGNRVMLGGEWTATGNGGRGTWYDDLRYAPTWREYRYDRLPWMHNVALYGEDRFTLDTNADGGQLQVTAGLRADVTHVGQSAYGTVASLAPRFNAKWTLWRGRDRWWVDALDFHAGWGKSVKLPSFDVLYPAPAYADRIAFTPGSTADGKAFYAYSVTPFTPNYNPNLRWQYSHQFELGVEAHTRIATVQLSAFFSQVHRPYLTASEYTPFSYVYTSQAALEGDFAIASANRQYAIDRQTGIVTVTDRTGAVAPIALAGQTRNTFNAVGAHLNGSTIRRSGIDWTIDFKPIAALRTSVRVDGNYYRYRGVEHTLVAWQPSGQRYMSDGVTPYQYVGHYAGSALSGAISVANGSVTSKLNNNVTLVTHIPSLRLVVSLRIEATLLDTSRSLSEGAGGASRGYVLAQPTDYFGTPYTGNERDCFVALWPEYYTTWEQPDVPVPFAERFVWARDHDPQLFNDLAALVVKTSHSYDLNPDRVSAYVSGNLNITKEIGDHVAVSLLANNFWNSMARVKSRQTGLRTTIYNSGYIPPFYYGLSVRVKL